MKVLRKQYTKADITTIGFLFTMLTIPILNFLIFWVYVNFNSILLAFQLPSGDFSLVNFQWFFENFQANDSVMLESLINTLIFFFVGLIFITPCSILLSYFLYKKILGHNVFRVVFFLPSIISAVVLTTVYKAVIGPTGPLATIAGLFGKTWPEVLAHSKYALTTIIIYNILTSFGTNVILMSGAMARIPIEILESASLDGVTMRKELLSIVLPLIWPTISTLLIFAIADLFSSSGPILLLTKGNYKTMTISYWIFDQVNTYNSLWNASAAGFVYTCIGLPITFGAKYLLEKVGKDVDY